MRIRRPGRGHRARALVLTRTRRGLRADRDSEVGPLQPFSQQPAHVEKDSQDSLHALRFRPHHYGRPQHTPQHRAVGCSLASAGRVTPATPSLPAVHTGSPHHKGRAQRQPTAPLRLHLLAGRATLLVEERSCACTPPSLVCKPGLMADDVLWNPPADALSTSRLGRYLSWLAREQGPPLHDATTSYGIGRSRISRASGNRCGSSSRCARMRRTSES